MFNKVIIAGYLARDPEIRQTTQGTPVTTLRLACTVKHRTAGEGQKEETLFIDAVVWGKYAETCSTHLTKGCLVIVDGRLVEDSWESDGQRRSKMQVVARDVRFLSRSTQSGDKSDDNAVEPF